MKTLNFTERDIELLLHCIGTNIETVKRRHNMTGFAGELIQELAQIDRDIRSQSLCVDETTTPNRSDTQAIDIWVAPPNDPAKW
jgi:glycerol-3-phosphate responsive antiterminator